MHQSASEIPADEKERALDHRAQSAVLNHGSTVQYTFAAIYIVIEQACPAHVHLSSRQNHSLVDGTTVSSAAKRRAQQRQSGPKMWKVILISGDGLSERVAMGEKLAWPDRRVHDPRSARH